MSSSTGVSLELDDAKDKDGVKFITCARRMIIVEFGSFMMLRIKLFYFNVQNVNL